MGDPERLRCFTISLAKRRASASEASTLLYRFQIRCWRCSHYVFDDLRDIVEADLLLQKRSDRDLIGGVESDGFAASAAVELPRKPNADKGI